MVLVLPESPSFGQQFARNLGAGVSQGLGQSFENIAAQRKQKMVMSLLGMNPEQAQSQESGQGQPTRQSQQDPFSRAKAAAVLGEHTLSRVFSEEGKIVEKGRLAKEAAAEPKLLEMEDKLRGLEQSGMRFERLSELFSPELEGKFPSALTSAAFTKDGELRPTAAALLSPEAQESVKLVADELSGAKDTFGSRVTNFDLQSYMKRLPTLLNTPDGRRRVLRDLRLMNDINKMHSEGVLDIIDKHGGPGGISVSKAERMFRKDFAPRIKELREQFVNPDKTEFSELPSASMYSGRAVMDPETGQKFRSNGKEWVQEQQ